MSHDCCMTLPRDAMGLSAVCDCGISRSYSLNIFDKNFCTFVKFPCLCFTSKQKTIANKIVEISLEISEPEEMLYIIIC